MYPHLAVKTDFSFMEGASKLKDVIATAKKLGVKSLALTDRENMYGAFDFSKVAKAEGIMPIIGTQLPIKFGEGGRVGYIFMLSMNDIGYQNICHVMSDVQKLQADGRPKAGLDPKLLMKKSEGVIVLSGADDGMLMEGLRGGDPKKVDQAIKFFQTVYGDRFYCQINRNFGPRDVDDLKHEAQLIAMSKDPRFGGKRADGSSFTGIPLVATGEVRYTSKDRHDAYELLQAMKNTRRIDVEGDTLSRHDDVDYHMLSKEEMDTLFSDIPYALENATHLANRCSFIVESRDPILPRFTTEEGRTEIEELREQSLRGLEMRLEGRNLSDEEHQRYLDRLNYELGIIESMGFPGYFLIVSDFIKWAKGQDIPVGPGRGSGAGSMVAWALVVTDLDPFQFGLLFERFLNPERVSMPDFDIDICKDRREEVIAYVAKKYGDTSVSQIGTFGEVKSKNALKNVGRVLLHPQHGGFGFGEMNELTQLIPNKDGSQEPHNLKDAFEASEEFSGRVSSSSKLKMLFDYSCMVEGLYDKVGSHAAGVIIGDRELDQLLPMRWDEKSGKPVCQFNMKAAESVGLVKFDFLGLKTLSVIKEAVDNIKNYRGVDVDIDNVPIDDEGVYEMFAKGHTNGVFQFESGGMQNALKQVKPTRLEDLIAVNALYRPGPMDQIDHYANCKNGDATPYYPNPIERTKPFLEETFGIMVYQEQVMMVAQEVAGYSLGGADLLRRAMGKKIPAEMDKQRKTFVDGAVEKGTPEKEANDLFDTIAKFAGYGFNKSHAAAYAYIAYQTAWLKHHYPAEFFAALLSYTDMPEKMALIKDDMAMFGVEMLPPDISASYPRFRPEKSRKSTGGFGIRFGLGAIKGFSADLKEFVQIRSEKPFKDIKDFALRGGEFFDKSKIEKLAEAGAFDCFDQNRLRSLSLVNWHLKNAKGKKNQTSFFDDDMIEDVIPEDIMDVQDWGNKLDREFNTVGFYFNTHPIDHFAGKLQHKGVRTLADHQASMTENAVAQKNDCYLCAMVEGVFAQHSARGNYYMNLKLSEKMSGYTAVFFGNKELKVSEAHEIAKSAKENRVPAILRVNLALENSEGKLSIYVQDVIKVDEFLKDVHGDIEVSIDVSEIQDLPETSRKKVQAKADLEKGKISQETHDDIIKKARDEVIFAKMNDLKEYLSSLEEKRPGEGVEVSLSLSDKGKVFARTTLPYKCVITPASESRIKAIDGVVRVAEAVKNLKDNSKAADKKSPQTPPSPQSVSVRPKVKLKQNFNLRRTSS